MKLNQDQQTVINWLTDETASSRAVVRARAGSGKTFLIRECIRRIADDKTALYLVFNKKNQLEAKKKLKGDHPAQKLTVKTIHSLAMSVFNKHKGKGYKYILEIDKNSVMYKQHKDELKIGFLENTDLRESDFYFQYVPNVKKLLSLAKNYLIDPNDIKAPITLGKLAMRHGLNTAYNEVEVVMGFLSRTLTFTRNTRKGKIPMFDFDDILYYIGINRLKMWTYDYVFVDECQDLNIAQKTFVDMVIGDNTRSLFVGDPAQSIYGFAGSDHNSFSNIVRGKDTTLFPLRTNYRCSKSIIKHVQNNLNIEDIQAHDGAPEGFVGVGSYKNVTYGDFVISRNRTPLLLSALDFIANNIPVKILGTSYEENLKAIAFKPNGGGLRSFDEIEMGLITRALRTKKLLMSNGVEFSEVENHELYKEVVDLRIIYTVISMGCETTRDYIKRLDEIFIKDIEQGGDLTNKVVFTTAHKSKGLETDNVYVLANNLFTDKFDELQDWQKGQELNLMYVTHTRARQNLTFVNDFDLESKRNQYDDVRRNMGKQQAVLTSTKSVTTDKQKANVA